MYINHSVSDLWFIDFSTWRYITLGRDVTPSHMINFATYLITVYRCSECFYGYWGPLCEQSCSVQCTPSGTQTLCDKDTAACVGACLPGYWQDDCQLECPNCLGDLCSKDNGRFSLKLNFTDSVTFHAVITGLAICDKFKML